MIQNLHKVSLTTEESGTIVADRPFPRNRSIDDIKGSVVFIDDCEVHDQLKSYFDEGKPATLYGVINKLGNRHAKKMLAILDELTANGVLAKFRGGLSNYYALPEVALTKHEPRLNTVIADSLKSMILGIQFKSR